MKEKKAASGGRHRRVNNHKLIIPYRSDNNRQKQPCKRLTDILHSKRSRNSRLSRSVSSRDCRSTAFSGDYSSWVYPHSDTLLNISIGYGPAGAVVFYDRYSESDTKKSCIGKCVSCSN